MVRSKPVRVVVKPKAKSSIARSATIAVLGGLTGAVAGGLAVHALRKRPSTGNMQTQTEDIPIGVPRSLRDAAVQANILHPHQILQSEADASAAKLIKSGLTRKQRKALMKQARSLSPANLASPLALGREHAWLMQEIVRAAKIDKNAGQKHIRRIQDGMYRYDRR